MAISVNPTTFVISIPKSDLTLVSGTLYKYDTNAFRLELKSWEDNGNGLNGGITFLKTHKHNTEVTIAGIPYARTIEILAPYKVEFEDGAYSVRLEGSNNNIWDIEGGILIQNQVQVIPTNSAGLIVVTQGSGLSVEENLWLKELHATRGLSLGNPAEASKTFVKVPNLDIVIEIDSNGETATYTRQP